MSHKILVTGAGGFIGGFVVEAALSRNYETWAGVRASTSREYLQDSRIRFVNLDFGNAVHLKEQLLELKKEIGRWEYIVHNLGVTKSKNRDDFDKINYGYLRNFVEALTACEMVPDKFIYMSSLGAWGKGDEKDYTPIRPTDTPHPDTRYGQSKLRSEQFLESVTGFPYIALRPTGVYGPREKDYYLMFKSIKCGIDFGVGYRRQLLTFIYIKDLVNAIFAAIDSPAVRKGYFLSEGKAYTTSEFRRYVAQALHKRWVLPVIVPCWFLWIISAIAEWIAAKMGKSSTLNRDKYHIMSQRNWLCDISEAQHEIGFSPRYSLEEGIQETIAWYKSHHWL